MRRLPKHLSAREGRAFAVLAAITAAIWAAFGVLSSGTWF